MVFRESVKGLLNQRHCLSSSSSSSPSIGYMTDMDDLSSLGNWGYV